MESFVFDDVSISPDRQIGKHSAPSWELSHVIRGRGERTVGDHTETFGEGDTVLIPPGIPHVWRFDPETAATDGTIANISVFFMPQLLYSLKAIFPETGDTVGRLLSLNQAVSFSGKARDRISALLMSMRGLTAESRLPRMIELLTMLSDFTESRFAGRGNLLGRAERRLERIRVYCACNYARTITLDEICRYTGMNRSAFCTFMRRHAGVSFTGYVNDLRLARAKEKLARSDESIAETAAECGFSNVTYFNRLFLAKYGITPRQARQRKD